MIDCSREKNLDHYTWLYCQLKKFRKAKYRDVILHTSIIESVIIAESKLIKPFQKKKYRSFNYAINILKDNYKDNFKIKKEIEIIEKCWQERCKLIHGIIENKLDQEEIGKLIKELYSLILSVYELHLFDEIFLNRGYSFSPKNIK